MSGKIVDLIGKSEDKKDIEMEEREQMLNAENKAAPTVGTETQPPPQSGDDKKLTKNNEGNAKGEGMEVKPKKIPIGGIQMPGFFTRSKSKEKCKVSQTKYLNIA